MIPSPWICPVIPKYSRRVYLELIVGTADQLNLNNTRYIVDVELSSYDDLLTATAADAEGVPIDVYDTYLSENNRYGNIYQIGVDKNDWTSGEQAQPDPWRCPQSFRD